MERLQRTEAQRDVFFFESDQLQQSLGPYAAEALRTLSESVQTYVEQWYGLRLSKISSLPPLSRPCIIMVDESGVPALMRALRSTRETGDAIRVLVMCDNHTRKQYLKVFGDSDSFYFVSKPIGPYKLAKSLRICLERSRTHEATTGQKEQLPNDAVKKQRDHRSPILDFEGNTAANLDSTQALYTLPAPAPESSATQGGFPFLGSEAAEYPAQSSVSTTATNSTFAVNETANTATDSNHLIPDSARPKLCSVTSARMHDNGLSAQSGASAGAAAKAEASDKQQGLVIPSPRILMVDDNNLNLRLLQTFANKRKCEHVTLATNGLEAVQAFEAALTADPPRPHQVIFLDISMPVMDGFEAATRIRTLEAERNAKLGPLETPPQTLIIAVTGLASERDQSRIFEAGIDLYMCKPVSFKEMGKFLDRWSANAEAELAGTRTDSVLRGSVTGANASRG